MVLVGDNNQSKSHVVVDGGVTTWMHQYVSKSGLISQQWPVKVAGYNIIHSLP
jgi:hypothetical protein